MSPLLRVVQALAMHAPSTAEDKLSVALWTGVSVLLALGLAGLLFGLKLVKKWSAARTRPCSGCGRFFDAGSIAKCPFCGALVAARGAEADSEDSDA